MPLPHEYARFLPSTGEYLMLTRAVPRLLAGRAVAWGGGGGDINPHLYLKNQEQ